MRRACYRLLLHQICGSVEDFVGALESRWWGRRENGLVDDLFGGQLTRPIDILETEHEPGEAGGVDCPPSTLSV
jgi:hypothetical protein